ncbi:hypothetical protein STAS_33665 [Striga asiatica]|uniref:Uncharacterized protein n=1 Tax=Striga asiatica TaxID=4170 RepID=A0A5A7RFL7_STRAF|nr:hypothetical protein STAS_33665 [Striga asiatica]
MALVSGPQCAVRESGFLSFDPRPNAPRDFVIFEVESFDGLVEPVVAIVVVYEEFFDSEPRMVHYPLTYGRGLVPNHRANAKLVSFLDCFIIIIIIISRFGFRGVDDNLGHGWHESTVMMDARRESYGYADLLRFVIDFTKGNRKGTPHDFLSGG